MSRKIAYSVNCAVVCCLRWAAQPGLQLTADEAVRLLAAVAALACTLCKCAVLQAADEAATADAAGAAEAAQAGAAVPGARAACAGPSPVGLKINLLIVAGNCELLAVTVAAQQAAPSAHLHRWGGRGVIAAVCV